MALSISFEVLPGEVHVILATQSFALETLMGLLKSRVPVTGGKVMFNNQPVTMRRLLKRKNAIALISENDDLYDYFSGFKNIFFFTPQYVHGGRKRAQFQRQCREFLNRYHVSINLDQKVYELTHEEKKIIEIIRAYIQGARVVIMYETITRVLDSFATEFPTMLDEWKKKGVSVLYLTTQPSDALAIGDRISVFSDGRINGSMMVSEAKQNPTTLFRMLAGGSLFLQQEQDSQEKELLSVISTARDIMSTNKELRQTLNFLSNNLRHIKNAEDCVIYVINERDNLVISSDPTQEETPRLTPEVLSEALHLAGDASMSLTPADPLYGKIMPGAGKARQVYFYSAFVRYDISALIQLVFSRMDAMGEQDTSLICTFGREVRVAIETSLILEHSSLLQESHHRIKNNLQSIIGLIYMQKYNLNEQNNLTKEMVNDSLTAIINRIKAIASIHDILAKDRFGWNNVDLGWLIRRILQFYEKSDIEITCDMDEIRIPYSNATSFALLMNELLSNCIKHAFIGIGSGKRIRIYCRIHGQELMLRVSDNGVGLDNDFRIGGQSSIGMSVISSIAQEFNARLSYNGENGTTVEICVPKSSLYRI